MARELLTRDDADPTLTAEAGYVKRIFKRIAPAVVWLTLLDGTTIGVTPEHEVYTEAQGWRYVSELEASSSLVDATGAPLTIVAIEVDPTPRPVYNLETSCGTYFAQGVWAHNSKCSIGALNKLLGGPNKLTQLGRTVFRWGDGPDGARRAMDALTPQRAREILHEVSPAEVAAIRDWYWETASGLAAQGRGITTQTPTPWIRGAYMEQILRLGGE